MDKGNYRRVRFRCIICAVLSPRLSFSFATVKLSDGRDCLFLPFEFDKRVFLTGDMHNGLRLEFRQGVNRHASAWRYGRKNVAALSPKQIRERAAVRMAR